MWKEELHRKNFVTMDFFLKKIVNHVAGSARGGVGENGGGAGVAVQERRLQGDCVSAVGYRLH